MIEISACGSVCTRSHHFQGKNLHFLLKNLPILSKNLHLCMKRTRINIERAVHMPAGLVSWIICPVPTDQPPILTSATAVYNHDRLVKIDDVVLFLASDCRTIPFKGKTTSTSQWRSIMNQGCFASIFNRESPK